MRRLKFLMAYDGTNYHGFARQPNAITVQQVIEDAIYSLTKQKVEVIGSGRTDTGVHAKGQCCIIDIETSIPTERFGKALNGRLPKDIVIRDVEDVSTDFHPRYAVKKKTYRYQLLTSRQNDPFVSNYVYFYPYHLNIDFMREAAEAIIGTHDFKCFCSAGTSVQTTVRTIYSLEIRQIDDMIQIDICGNGFLYNMVRIIVGTLIQVGIGKIYPSKMAKIIESADRNLAGPTAPPTGLTMLDIKY
ncbi:MAG: tRNA pseudouridine(38-40) synthase TruA [Cellulosilyticaceae bacterium]